MADHDSPISLSPSGGSLARVIVAEQNADHWKIPEGTILASATRRELLSRLMSLLLRLF